MQFQLSIADASFPKTTLAGIALVALLLVCSFISLVSGPIELASFEGLLTLIDVLAGTTFSSLDSFQQTIVLDLRLPRLLLALFVGAILAQCGAVMQGLFRNPLADPGIVGVSSGAAVGAVIAIGLIPEQHADWAVPLFAFLGGLITTLVVYKLAQSAEGTSVLLLLLSGIAISAFAGAFIGFVTYFADDQKLRALSLWQMGSLGGATSTNILLSLSILVILAWQFQRRANAINALLLGESEARHLGIEVEKLKIQLIVLTAVGVGVAVACSGMIGFVGLVVPHIIRLMLGPNHRSLLPLSALCGALLLMLSDLAARTLVQPAELPVGVVTALIGAPFFLFLLLQQRKHGGM